MMGGGARFVGQRVIRKEDARFLTGHGQYRGRHRRARGRSTPPSCGATLARGRIIPSRRRRRRPFRASVRSTLAEDLAPLIMRLPRRRRGPRESSVADPGPGECALRGRAHRHGGGGLALPRRGRDRGGGCRNRTRRTQWSIMLRRWPRGHRWCTRGGSRTYGLPCRPPTTRTCEVTWSRRHVVMTETRSVSTATRPSHGDTGHPLQLGPPSGRSSPSGLHAGAPRLPQLFSPAFWGSTTPACG